MSARQLLEEARRLSVAERMDLVADIWDSVRESEEVPFTADQREEMVRRLAYYDQHPEERGRPLSEIMARLRLRQ